MSKNKVRICVIDTVYTLFLYLLIFGYDCTDIFIFSEGISKNIKNQIKHINFPKLFLPYKINSSKLSKIRQIPINLLIYSFSIIRLRFILFIKTRKKVVEVYGQGHLNYSFPLYEYENSYLIEDGLSNYFNLKKPSYQENKLKNFFGKYYKHYKEGFGTHKNIKKIYLTKNNVPEIIKDKVIICNLNDLWNSKSIDEQDFILNLFDLKEIIHNIDNNITLLITEPFSEDGLLPFDEEIRLYSNLIEKNNDKNIIIKSHPREEKNYKEIFPNLTVIDKPFPIELFPCIGIKIDKIIAVASTVVLNLSDECEIQIYDGKTSSKDINQFIEYIHKTLNEKSDGGFN